MECSTYSLEPAIPLVFAAGDYWTARVRKKLSIPNGLGGSSHNESDKRGCEILFRRLLCAALVSVASTITLVLERGLTSTNICPVFLNPSWLIPSLQLAGTAMDALIIYCIIRLLSTDDSSPTPRSIDSRLETIGKSLAVRHPDYFNCTLQLIYLRARR